MTATREIPRDIVDTVSTARELQRDGDAKIDQAAQIMRATAKRLAEQGWTQADIGVALGVSKQRVSQLVNPPKKATTKA
jgi:predicted XRE-type DNA-binding protein